jgi:phage gp29-like protein
MPEKNRLSADLTSESAPRRIDPWARDYLGIIRPNDPLLEKRGETIDAYLTLIEDDKVFSCLQKRIGALVARPWAVEPVHEGDTKSAEAMEALLRRIPFDRLCRDLLQALLIGYTVVEIVWQVADGLVLPKALPVRRARRFIYKDVEGGAPELRLITETNMVEGVPLPDRKFIVHRVNPRDDNPYGMGLGLQLFWPVFFKKKGIIAWAKFCDRFGTPTLWGRYPNNAEARDKRTLGDALQAFSNDGYVMTPEGAAIELLEAHGAGNITTQAELIRCMDDAIAAIILGQDAKSESGGALAAASKERSAVRLDLVQADSDLLSETLNGSLIAWLCEFNGIGAVNVFRQVKEEEDLKASAETDAIIAGMGFALSEDAIRTKYGEGWTKATPPPSEQGGQSLLPSPRGGRVAEGRERGVAAKQNATPENATPAFADPPPLADPAQTALDAAVADIPDAEMDAAMEDILSPFLAAIHEASDFEDALARAAAALPTIPAERLADLLNNAMFDAELYGRLAPEAGP